MIISNSDNEKLVMNTIMATTATTVALIITTIIKITMKKKKQTCSFYILKCFSAKFTGPTEKQVYDIKSDCRSPRHLL